MGDLVEGKLPCPVCPSSDAYHVYIEEDGTLMGSCYSCDHNGPHTDEGIEVPVESTLKKEKKPRDMLCAPIAAVPERNLSLDTCKKFDLGSTTIDGRKYYTFGYYVDGLKKMSKVRGPDKCFDPRVDPNCGPTGDTKVATLFGMQSFKPDPKKSITLCEGEFDAASAYEMSGKFPAVSVRSSGQAEPGS